MGSPLVMFTDLVGLMANIRGSIQNVTAMSVQPAANDGLAI